MAPVAPFFVHCEYTKKRSLFAVRPNKDVFWGLLHNDRPCQGLAEKKNVAVLHTIKENLHFNVMPKML